MPCQVTSIKRAPDHLLFANGEYIRLDLLQIRYHDKRTLVVQVAGGKTAVSIFSTFCGLR